MEDKTLQFMRIYSPEDKGRLCILGNVKEGPTSKTFSFLFSSGFLIFVLRQQQIFKRICGCRSSTPSLSFKVISSKIHGINSLCTSEDRRYYFGVDKTFSTSLVLLRAFSRAFLRISVHLSKIYGSDLYEL